MTLPSAESIQDRTEKAVTLIEWLAAVLRSRNWVKKLVLLDVLLAFALLSLPVLTPYLGVELPKPSLGLGGMMVALVFLAAVLVALRTVRPNQGAVAPDLAARSVIKGLRPFTFEDAALFARLQRAALVREGLEALTDPEFRFGILCGASGCGKTSFLQAGLWPRLTAPDAPHRGVYVKCSDLDPLESLRQALIDQLQLSPAAGQPGDLLALLATAVQATSKPLVVLFDQFEQFFVQRPRKADRDLFMHALAAWYRQQPPLPVKMVVCIRGDMSDRLIELQKAMGYTLGPQHLWHLEAFTPREAAEVFRVIAEAEELTFDARFVDDLVRHELANRDDGLVSPVDVQILAWMIKGQKLAAERGFTRTAYQKLGGIEGLLDQFLARALGARETPARREAALKVLLALTDLEHNARAGVLTSEQLEEKLAGTVASGEAQEAVTWLARGDVRLVTPITRDGTPGYELAHERLIPALRRLARRELSAVDRANQLLERRVNEWLGNECAARYVLTWRELRMIERQRPYLVWGPKQPLKEQLLAHSRRRWRVRLAAALLPVILPLGVLAGWYWDAYHRAYVEHYANVITRWGLPEGVGRLTDEQVRRRNTTLAFSKRGRRGPVHEIRLVNSRGMSPPQMMHTGFFLFSGLSPLPEEREGSPSEGLVTCRVTFERDAGGLILNQRAYTCAGRELYTLHYAYPGWAAYQEGAIVGVRRESGIAHLQFLRPESGPEAGLAKEVRFFDRDGKPQPDRDGTYGVQQVFDAQGRVVERIALGADRQPTVNRVGIARAVYTYDALGNPTRTATLGPDLQPVPGANGVAGTQVAYDDYGNLTEIAYLGTEGQLVILGRLGIAGRTFRYDAQGNIVEGTFFGPNRQLVRGGASLLKERLSFAKFTIVWDAQGRALETYFGPDGKPIKVSSRAVKTRSVLDARGYIGETAYLDEHDQPTRNDDGCAKVRMTNDEQGNQTEMACLDETDHPVRDTDGVAKVKRRYDERGRVTEAMYFGPHGRPERYEEQYVKVRLTYNPQGKVIERVYLDAADRPVHTKEGYAKLTYRYNLQGQLSEIAFLNGQDRPTPRQGGYAQLRRTYDVRGNLIEETFLDPQGNPVRHDDGYVKATFAYDDRGYRIEQAYFDEHGQPTWHTDGNARRRSKYNESGQLVEHTYYGLDGSPVLLKEHGYAKVQWTYDVRGHVSQHAYFDPHDRPVQTVYGYAMIRVAYDDFGREMTREFLDVNGAPVQTRVAIRKFKPGSNGERLGLQVGDLLIRYAGEDVANTHVFRELELVRGERRRELRIQRQGTVLTLDMPSGRLQGLDLVDSVPFALNKTGT
jgi:YD repeat-containing protein